MKRLNVLDFYNLGHSVAKLSEVLNEKARRGEVFFLMIDVRGAVRTFVAGEGSFTLARNDAQALGESIDEFVATHVEDSTAKERRFKDLNEELETWTWWKVKSAIEHFVHVFQSECRAAETYVIPTKLIYNTSALLHHASQNP